MASTSTTELQVNADRLHEDFIELAEIGATSEIGVSRLALSSEDLQARAWFANRIEESGFLVHDDEVGNLSGILLSKDSQAKTLLIGSHLDTVPNGGRYDGSIGVLAGLECLRVIQEAGLELPVNLEVISFTDEEGTWESLFGSRGFAGMLNNPDRDKSDEERVAFHAALGAAGIHPHEMHLAARNADTLHAYLELHIEQGMQLQRDQNQIGIVTNIVGRATYHITFYGKAGHSGTTFMEERQDALQGASSFISAVHQETNKHFPESTVNVGDVRVKPGRFNVIPNQAQLVFECRHPDNAVIEDIELFINELAQQCATTHNLQAQVDLVLRRGAAKFDSGMMAIIGNICEKAGYTYQPLVSYAGHDAQVISTLTPAAMIFVTSQNGVSHNPMEFTEWDDVVRGTNVLLQTVLQVAHR